MALVAAAPPPQVAEDLRELIELDEGELVQRQLDAGVEPPRCAQALMAEPKRCGEVILSCLGGSGAPSAPKSHFTELEAMTALVRLIGAGEGDLRGDADLAGVPFAGIIPLTAMVEEVGVDKADPLRGEAAMRAVVGVLERHAEQFDRGEEAFLQLETLRALRLQLLPPPESETGPRAWWAEPPIGEDRNGPLRRLLVDVVLRALRGVADARLSRRPQTIAFGCLRSLTACSPSCRTHALRNGAAELAVKVLWEQTRDLNNYIHEPPLILCCEALSSLSAGSRSNARTVAEAGADTQALEVMRRFGHHRQLAAAAFALLGAVARDEAAGARVAKAGQQALSAVQAVLDRWPEEVQAALQGRQPPAPKLMAALDALEPPMEYGVPGKKVQAAPVRPVPGSGRALALRNAPSTR